MRDLNQKLYDHPELGIAPEIVNGRQMYRHRQTPATPGKWISGEKVRAIADRIPDYVLPEYEAERVVGIIEDFGLGEGGLRIAQENHYNALMGDRHGLLPQAAARKAAEVAKRYGLGDEAVEAAEKRLCTVR